MLSCASNDGTVNKVNYEQLLNLIHKLDQSSLAYLRYEQDDSRIELAKEVPHRTSSDTQTNQQQLESKPSITTESMNLQNSNTMENGLESSAGSELSQTTDEPQGISVLSPMVGVVYMQPAPDKPPYVQVGDHVEKGQVVVLIEAMKLMTEIKADRSGIVTEIMVENEDLVEFDQPLVRIKEEK